MKLRITKKDFIKELDKVNRAISSSISLPSLQGVLITATESNITLLGSDGTFAIKNVIDNSELNKVVEPGTALIPAKLFREVISKQTDLVEIATNESKIIISSQGSNASMSLINHDEYPRISFDVLDKEFVIDAETFNTSIKNVSFAAGVNDRRIILNGVNLSAAEGKLKLTATNSYRLAQENIEIGSNSEFNITVLSKNIKEFLPKDVKGEIRVSIDDSKIITKTGNLTILSRLIDGVYPNVDKLIPTDFVNVLTIDKSEIDSLLDKVTVIASESNRIVRLVVNKEVLSLEAKRAEIGETKSETTNFEYQGEEFEIAFNAQFLKDASSKFKGKLTIGFIGDQKPFVVKSESKSQLTQLILPHRSY